MVGAVAWVARFLIEWVFYSVFWGIGWLAITVLTLGRVVPRTTDEDIVGTAGMLVAAAIVAAIVLPR